MERAMGLEPTTFSLATRRSTTELCPLVLILLKVLAFLKLSKGENIFYYNKYLYNFKQSGTIYIK